MKKLIQPADLSNDFFEFDVANSKVRIKQLYTVSQLRNETKNPPLVFVNDLIKGFFILDVNDTTSVDDNLSIIVTNSGSRYKKQLSNYKLKIGVSGFGVFDVGNEDLIKFVPRRGIDMEINANKEVIIQNRISTEAANRIRIHDDGGLYSDIPPINISEFISNNPGNIIYPINNKLYATGSTYISAIGYDQIDSLNVIYSDGVIIKVKITPPTPPAIQVGDIISADTGNIITVRSNKLYATIAVYIVSTSYDSATGELVVLYSNGTTTRTLIVDVQSRFDRVIVTGTLGQPFNVDYLNKNLHFKGAGLVAIPDSATNTITYIMSPVTYNYTLTTGNVLNAVIPANDAIISVNRNGVFQKSGVGKDYTAVRTLSNFDITFALPFGNSSGAKSTGETIDIVTSPSE